VGGASWQHTVVAFPGWWWGNDNVIHLNMWWREKTVVNRSKSQHWLHRHKLKEESVYEHYLAHFNI